MNNVLRISDEVSVGPQPSLEDLQQLRKQGFQSVVNFREDGEDDQPLSPHDEGNQAREMEFDYLHVPVNGKSMKAETVSQFRQRYHFLPKPVYAHCKSGKRAGAMVLMTLGAEKGWTGEETLQKAEQLGFQCDQPQLQQFVKNYVNNYKELPARAGE